jgi:16S rRNA processing protein RimM
MASKDSLELGRIGAPYGIKGWVHVQSFTHPPEKLLKYRSWSLSAAQVERVGSVQAAGAAEAPAFKVVEGRLQGKGLVARLEGIEDRDRAALLQGSMISVARSLLPKLRKREFYQADLIGLSVTNLEGVALGEVSHFVETPGGDVMIVRSGAGQEHWVPATKEHLSKVDLAAGQVVVDWPAVLE